MRRRTQDGICEVDCLHPTTVARAKARLRSEGSLRAMARAFKVLAHPNRLRILRALDGRELCVCDLSLLLGLSMSGTSQQLKELRSLGAIDYRTEGRLVFYTLTDPFWLALSESVAERLGHPAPKRASPRKAKPRRSKSKSKKPGEKKSA